MPCTVPFWEIAVDGAPDYYVLGSPVEGIFFSFVVVWDVDTSG
jgi:hypothetical protein